MNVIICGENLKVMAEFKDNSVDAIVTDIPYGIGFMGKEWDTFKNTTEKANKAGYENRQTKTEIRKSPLKGYASKSAHAGLYDLTRNAEYQEWCRIWSTEALRIAKPGAFLLCFGGTRTVHRATCGIEDAGWLIRDKICWIFGSGFPKSLRIALQYEQRLCERKNGDWYYKDTKEKMQRQSPFRHPKANEWAGYGTALKPAWEPIIIAMKPLDGTFAANAEKWGVAGLNIDGGRIGTEDVITNHSRSAESAISKGKYGDSSAQETHQTGGQKLGRFPANLILDEEAAAMLDEQSGECKTGNLNKVNTGIWGSCGKRDNINHKGSSGGASRFFYCAKASRAERNAGLEGMATKTPAELTGRKVGSKGLAGSIEHGNSTNPFSNSGSVEPSSNHHPTVKPLKLMQYLCRLLKPPEGGILLDPFCGSGTTLMAAVSEGWDCIGIDREAEYVEIAEKRVAWMKEQLTGQMGLFK